MSTKKLKFFKFIIDRLFKSKSSFNLSSMVLKISIFSITLAIAILIPVMSIMNGFEFLSEIKDTKIKSIPILVLTGADLDDNDKSFLKNETEKVIHKTDDTVLSIAEEINKVIKRTG